MSDTLQARDATTPLTPEQVTDLMQRAPVLMDQYDIQQLLRTPGYLQVAPERKKGITIGEQFWAINEAIDDLEEDSERFGHAVKRIDRELGSVHRRVTAATGYGRKARFRQWFGIAIANLAAFSALVLALL